MSAATQNIMPIFDTLQFTDELRAAGVPEQQARAHAKVMMSAFHLHLDRLATKDDLNESVLRLESKISHMQWMLGMVGAGVGVVLLRLFFPG